MKVMSRAEIVKDWAGFQKEIRVMKAQRVARYCRGHSIKEIGEWLGYGRCWVCEQLNYAGIAMALDGKPEAGGMDPHDARATPITGGMDGTSNATRRAANKMIQKYQPTESEMDDFEDSYVDHYRKDGYKEDVAKRLARAEWATHKAVDDGVIQEAVDKQNKKVTQILFPEDAADTVELQFKEHMARVRSASRFLDEVNMAFIKKQSTCDAVVSANEKWHEQVQRVLNQHQSVK